MSTTRPTGFDRFNLNPLLQRGIVSAGFDQPRQIQRDTIPAAMDGRDVLGLAQTGTGKTAAFALPILDRILAKPTREPQALIIAPTRELASQIEAEFQTLARHANVRIMTIYGGVSTNRQIQALRKNPEVIVACPGRLLDLMQQKAIRLDAIKTLVLDEADQMFDMGFLPDIRRIMKALPGARQNLLFSATMPRELRHLANAILESPHVVELERVGPARTIEHSLYQIEEKQKLGLLKQLIAGDDFKSAIVFTRTKHRAKRMAVQLAKSGQRAVALQGNMSQAQRDRAMAGFRARKSDILVATDIAARGLDIANVSHVINFDVPNTPDAYIHRIGRTGRAERTGKAFTFVTTDDRSSVHAIEKRIGSKIPRYQPDGVALQEPSSQHGERPPRSRRRARPGARSTSGASVVGRANHGQVSRKTEPTSETGTKPAGQKSPRRRKRGRKGRRSSRPAVASQS